MTPEKAMGYRLSVLRHEKGISQENLSKIMGSSKNMVYLWENGKADMSASKLRFFAQFYGVSADYILGLSDDPRRGESDDETI